MKITVTQKHIGRGIVGEPTNCPLAIAINEQCPTFEASVIPDRARLTLMSDCSDRFVPLSLEAMRFVFLFDSGSLDRGRDYTFDLAIPENVTEPVRSTSGSKRLVSANASVKS